MLDIMLVCSTCINNMYNFTYYSHWNARIYSFSMSQWSDCIGNHILPY